ncbi:hypothetical protein, partial [Intestinimonas sp.]|uniref:hypothetical protein n=1 Tax=Intestinimonas sp. TaxID=1965293 RepID=UPI003AB65D32
SGSARSAWEGLFAHTSEFYTHFSKGRKHLVWIPTHPHTAVTKREVISKNFSLLCVDFLARKCYHTNSSMFCVKLRKQSIFVGI